MNGFTSQCLSASVPQCLSLADDEIHLWLADLDQPPKPLVELAATLTADERERAARFRFPEHRLSFLFLDNCQSCLLFLRSFIIYRPVHNKVLAIGGLNYYYFAFVLLLNFSATMWLWCV